MSRRVVPYKSQAVLYCIVYRIVYIRYTIKDMCKQRRFHVACSIYCTVSITRPSVLRHCWLGDRKGIRPVKETGCWFVGGGYVTSFARLVAPVVTTTTSKIILSSNEIRNGDVLLPANPDPSGKWPLKRRERLYFCTMTIISQVVKVMPNRH